MSGGGFGWSHRLDQIKHALADRRIRDPVIRPYQFQRFPPVERVVGEGIRRLGEAGGTAGGGRAERRGQAVRHVIEKKLIGTSSTRERSNSRDAPTRLTPRSYF